MQKIGSRIILFNRAFPKGPTHFPKGPTHFPKGPTHLLEQYPYPAKYTSYDSVTNVLVQLAS
jgi:hypothetical protein